MCMWSWFTGCVLLVLYSEFLYSAHCSQSLKPRIAPTDQLAASHWDQTLDPSGWQFDDLSLQVTSRSSIQKQSAGLVNTTWALHIRTATILAAKGFLHIHIGFFAIKNRSILSLRADFHYSWTMTTRHVLTWFWMLNMISACHCRLLDVSFAVVKKNTVPHFCKPKP